MCRFVGNCITSSLCLMSTLTQILSVCGFSFTFQCVCLSETVGLCSRLISVYKDRFFFFKFLHIYTPRPLCVCGQAVRDVCKNFFFLARYCVTEMELWKFTKWFLLIVHSWLETGTLVFCISQGANVSNLGLKLAPNLCLSARKSNKQRFGILWVCASLLWKLLEIITELVLNYKGK